jgi:hypothetical protein
VREDVADKPDVTVVCKKAVVTYDYAAALLSAVLQGKKPVIYERCDVCLIGAEHTEQAALFLKLIREQNRHSILTV